MKLIFNHKNRVEIYSSITHIAPMELMKRRKTTRNKQRHISVATTIIRIGCSISTYQKTIMCIHCPDSRALSS
jgi:hypothetical protein